MRAVVQRVISSKVSVDDKIAGSNGRGLTVLIGVEDGDTQKDAEYIAKKVCALRVFDDDEGVMNLSVQDIEGEILAVSQFTLLGDVRKGNRPSYFQAAAPEEANSLYRKTVELMANKGVHVEEGVFQADMLVEINNDGPVTILLESRKLF